MNRLPFKLEATASRSAARATTFKTLHGTIKTPLFMPVGTKASVKGLRVEDLREAGSQILLANTYHLLLRPGAEVFDKFGGIHQYTKWTGSVLTDSGGFQIFSLPHARQMTEEGAQFRSYINGDLVHLSPEKSIAMQRAIGSDIMMVLDQCIPSTADHATATAAMHLTHRWARRSLYARGESRQALFGIVQGALFEDLRRESVAILADMNFDGYAIGGLAVGETKQQREDFTAFSAALLPSDKPRYLMGVGTPIDLLEAVHRGVDMFDCIIPTALSQQGVAYTSKGRLRLNRLVYKFVDEPLDPACQCYTCANYSKSYLHHLHKSSEPLAWQLTSIHNLHFYHSLMRKMREHILQDTFYNFYQEQRESLITQDENRPPLPIVVSKPQTKVPLNKGAFAVYESPRGFCSICHVESGEVMHPTMEPMQEAQRLYVDQANLPQRWRSWASKEPCSLWDVGLGAAYNAMAVILTYEKEFAASPDLAPPLVISSFETDLDALRLAASLVRRFPHLKHPAPHLILHNGTWTHKTLPLTWNLYHGNFFDHMHSAPAAHIIFYDPYSFKTNHSMWTIDAFKRIAAQCCESEKRGDCELYSYTASTRVRAAMLASGWYVAQGQATGEKLETTVALSEYAVNRRTLQHGTTTALLKGNWLSKWERSQARYPHGLDEHSIVAFEARVRGHSQFTLSN